MSWAIKYFLGIGVAVIFADNVIRNIWLAVSSGTSDGTGSILRTLGIVGTAAAVGGQSASNRRNGWSRWLHKRSNAVEQAGKSAPKRQRR